MFAINEHNFTLNIVFKQGRCQQLAIEQLLRCNIMNISVLQKTSRAIAISDGITVLERNLIDQPHRNFAAKRSGLNYVHFVNSVKNV